MKTSNHNAEESSPFTKSNENHVYPCLNLPFELVDIVVDFLDLNTLLSSVSFVSKGFHSYVMNYDKWFKRLRIEYQPEFDYIWGSNHYNQETGHCQHVERGYACLYHTPISINDFDEGMPTFIKYYSNLTVILEGVMFRLYRKHNFRCSEGSFMKGRIRYNHGTSRPLELYNTHPLECNIRFTQSTHTYSFITSFQDPNEKNRFRFKELRMERLNNENDDDFTDWVESFDTSYWSDDIDDTNEVRYRTPNNYTHEETRRALEYSNNILYRLVVKKEHKLDDKSSYKLLSVTGFIHSLFPEFNAAKVIDEMMTNEKKWLDKKENKYFGMTPDEIMAQWEETRSVAAAEGTFIHENIEKYYNHAGYDPLSREFTLFRGFEKEHVTNKLCPFRTEMIVYDKELCITGSIDMLYERGNTKYPCYNGTSRFQTASEPKHLIMCDWKRSKELKKYNPYQSGCVDATFTCGDCNYVHYTIQLCLYKYILEKNYNVIIDEMWLVLLHPNQETFIKENVIWYPPMMDGILKYRRDYLAKNFPDPLLPPSSFDDITKL